MANLRRRVALVLTLVLATTGLTAGAGFSPVSADSVVATIPVGSFPNGVALNPAGTFAYVPNSGSGKVSKINLTSNAVVATIPVGTYPDGVAVNPAGTFALVANRNDNTVSKINLATDSVVATVPVGNKPVGVTVNPAGTFAYVANSGSGNVSKMNLTTNLVTATITVGAKPSGVAVDPAGTFAYVSNTASNSVSKVNLASDTAVAAIPVGTNPVGIAVNPAGSFAYVANSGATTVSKINLATDTVVRTITSGANPSGIAVNPSGTFAYATNAGAGEVAKISLDTDAVISTITVGTVPVPVAVNAKGTYVYAANVISGTVSKIRVAAEPTTVTFNANSGSGSMGTQSASSPTALRTNTFTRANFAFAGWATSSGGRAVYADGATYPFTKDATLYAKWDAVPPGTKTVTFNANGGKGLMSPQSSSTPGKLKANTFTRKGFEFARWNTKADGSGVIYLDGQSYSFATNAKFFAQWVADPPSWRQQYPTTQCVKSGARMSVTGITTITGPHCFTNARQPVGTRVVFVSATRGDVRPAVRLVCATQHRVTAPVKLPRRYGLGSVFCPAGRGSLIAITSNARGVVVTTWHAPATGTYRPYTGTVRYGIH